jgi:hypothetical protein|tara:strand:- start:177 stop:446 length:270 start_codon:yes stop_codon:yes gene_type:complete
MNNKYDIEMGVHSYPSIKVKGRYDDENILVDVPLETEGTNKSWKNTFKNLHKSLVKGTNLSSEYTPVNIKIKKKPILPRSSKCDNCIIC